MCLFLEYCCSCLFLVIVLQMKNVNGVTDVRFKDASVSSIGIVQIKWGANWLYICRNIDYSREARVICRQLGYIGGWEQRYQVENTVGVSIHCEVGDEMSLSSCRVENVVQGCVDGYIVGVWCFNASAARLVDESNERPNIGRVQVQYDDSWTDVCFRGTVNDDQVWDLDPDNLNVLCKSLGYPGALFTSNLTLDTVKFASYKFTEDYKCNGGETALYQCLPDRPTNTPCERNSYVQAACASPGYVGCFHENVFANSFDMGMDENMTVQTCIKKCRKEISNVRYAALHNGNHCFCWTVTTNIEFRDAVGDSVCDDCCSGDKFGICGGAHSMSVYDVTLGECDDPGVPTNGVVVGEDNFQFGRTVTFACNSGFLLVGSPSIQCVLGHMPNESIWNGRIPTCEEIPTTTMESTTKSLPVISSNTGAGVIIGSVMSILVVFLIIIIIVYFIHRRKRQKQTSTSSNIKYHLSNNYGADVNLATVGNTSNTKSNRNSSYLPLPYEYDEVTQGKDTKAEPGRYGVDRPESEHIYSYADVHDLAKRPSGKPVNVVNKGIDSCTEELPYDYADIPKQNPSLQGNLLSNESNMSPDLYAYAYADNAKQNPAATKSNTAATSKTTELPYAYAYADVNSLAKDTSGMSNLSGKDNEHQEGWSENILYAKSGLDGHPPGGNRGDMGTGPGNEKEGWVENTMYVKGASASE